MRILYWYLTAYAKKHGLVFILSVVGAVILFSFLLPTAINSLEKRKRQYIGIVGDYSLTNLPDSIKQQLSAGLTKTEPDGTVSPHLAERWAVEQAGTTYRFLLKDNLYWQDGKPITPSEIHYRLNDVESISTPNDLVFKLPAAYAPFPIVVSEPIFRPSTQKRLFFFDQPTLIGIGNYSISNYKKIGSRLSELTVEGESERIIYRFYLTEEDAVLAFKRGEVDYLPNLARIHDIMDWSTTETTYNLQKNRYLAVFFNIRHPNFQKNVRQALSYAMDKPTGELRATGPLSPNSWAYLEGGKGYEKDLNRASERLLDGIPPTPLKLELTTTSLFEAEADQIKKEWESFSQKAYQDCRESKAIEDKEQCENVKITVSIRVTSLPDTSNFQLLLIGQEAPRDPDQYHLWHSEQSSNFTGYKNTRIDNLLEKGRQSYDQKERTEIYQEFQQFFLEDAPAIFIRYLESYDVKRR
jgi:peptide/nickel transport system substrate-binding protein